MMSKRIVIIHSSFVILLDQSNRAEKHFLNTGYSWRRPQAGPLFTECISIMLPRTFDRDALVIVASAGAEQADSIPNLEPIIASAGHLKKRSCNLCNKQASNRRSNITTTVQSEDYKGMATVSTKYSAPMRALLDHDIRAVIAAKTQADATDIPDEISLGDLGLDSLALSDLAEAIEEKFDVHIHNRMLPATLTVGQLSALIYENMGGYDDSPERVLVPEPAD